MEFAMWKDYLGLLEVTRTKRGDQQGTALRPTNRQGDKDTTLWTSERWDLTLSGSSRSEGVTSETDNSGSSRWAPRHSHSPKVDASDITSLWSLTQQESPPRPERDGFDIAPSRWSERWEQAPLLSSSPNGDISPTASPWRAERRDWTPLLSPQHGRKPTRQNTSPHKEGATPRGGKGAESQEKVLLARVSHSTPPHSGSQKGPSGCAFCKHNGEPKNMYSAHALKDAHGRVQCPVLRQYVCPRCQGTGDDAHTRRFCPLTEKGYTSVYLGTAGKAAERPSGQTEAQPSPRGLRTVRRAPLLGIMEHRLFCSSPPWSLHDVLAQQHRLCDSLHLVAA
ncbi:hypothetical protein NDU88_006401 [Pleurodeles waltl]|uniref:Nanos-type domain-containing protein n=1 Tax=Pleurodeles waltl TaxID=8319 RepID=A0AAV7PQJ4_PLEWA|nr:hypothetical protein NDU88_006401 [Pleurodeles waltl]